MNLTDKEKKVILGMAEIQLYSHREMLTILRFDKTASKSYKEKIKILESIKAKLNE